MIPIPVFAPRRPALSALGTDETPPKTSLDRGREAAALILFAASVYAGLALASFRADPLHPEVQGGDWVGPVGAGFAQGAVGVLGLVSWCVPLELALFAAPLLKRRPSIANLARLAGDVLTACVVAALFHIALPQATVFGAMPIGGSFGELFGEVLRSLFSTLGSYIIGLTAIGLILIGRASFSFIAWVERAERGTGAAAAKAKEGAKAVAGAWAMARDLERERADQQRKAGEPRIDSMNSDNAIIAALSDSDDDAAMETPPRLQISDSLDLTMTPPAVRLSPSPAPVAAPKKRRKETALKDVSKDATPKESGADPAAADVEAIANESAKPTDDEVLPAADLDDGVSSGADATASAAQGPKTKKKEPEGPTIVDTSGEMATRKPVKTVAPTAPAQQFRLPATDMLEPPPTAVVEIDKELLRRNAKLLEKTLNDYGVTGMVEEIHPGPTVTTYEVSPQAGTKVSKVASLADDLALGLSRKVRIIAPIPGKNRIGFEIPNESRVPVSLRDLIEDQRFLGLSVPLPVVLGRDHVGAPYFADLASMPHVIVAGATGAGKSVGLNVMLTSLLFRRTPEELRLLMIDPKVVELAPFDKIPHMLLPVVTDMKQASNALKWAVDEMERRYQMFANAGTKNISTYNGWVEKVRKGLVKAPPVKQVTAVGPGGEPVTVAAAADGSDAQVPDKIPYIVIVVDEFSDLMMQQGKDVEAAVARLAQKARAAGMHVILATQRPSVDVITGIIKANFPTRIAFRVSQKVDSRTILDEQGAEHLLGRGDMLVKMNGTNETRRVQCPFVSEEEVQKVTDFLRLQGTPVYDENILKPRDDENAEDADDETEQDALYDSAVRIVADTRRCSTSWLQRKLNLGYNRAARIVETMEKRGLVGPANGAKEREVLISSL
ncbi:MAG TPA: DNA translocase FtsK [Polyangiaceae bacterium]|nr:DNA translocase FtsK [Polyangiaceae bacterium]